MVKMVNSISYRNVLSSCPRAPTSHHIDSRPQTLEDATFNLTVEKETKLKSTSINSKCR